MFALKRFIHKNFAVIFVLSHIAALFSMAITIAFLIFYFEGDTYENEISIALIIVFATISITIEVITKKILKWFYLNINTDKSDTTTYLKISKIIKAKSVKYFRLILFFISNFKNIKNDIVFLG